MTKPERKPQAEQPKPDKPTLHWNPIATAPTDEDSEFFVREPMTGVPVKVKYRQTRAFDGAHGGWRPFLKLVYAETGLALLFKAKDWTAKVEAVNE